MLSCVKFSPGLLSVVNIIGIFVKFSSSIQGGIINCAYKVMRRFTEEGLLRLFSKWVALKVDLVVEISA